MTHHNIDFSKQIETDIDNSFNVRDELKGCTIEELQTVCKNDRLPFAIGLLNVTGDLNIGVSIRTALLLGASSVYLFGRRKYDKRSTVGAQNYIQVNRITYSDNIDCDIGIYNDLKNLPYTIVLMEHGGYELRQNNRAFYNQFERPPIFILGSESFGIPEIILQDKSFYRISIPQKGVLRSHNVSTAASIIMWDFVKEMYL